MNPKPSRVFAFKSPIELLSSPSQLFLLPPKTFVMWTLDDKWGPHGSWWDPHTEKREGIMEDKFWSHVVSLV